HGAPEPGAVRHGERGPRGLRVRDRAPGGVRAPLAGAGARADHRALPDRGARVTLEGTSRRDQERDRAGGGCALVRNRGAEYAIEALLLGLFMVSAGVVTTALEAPGSPLVAALPDAFARRALVGLGMGLTSVALVYSPLGGRSGAHMNPAVTLS